MNKEQFRQQGIEIRKDFPLFNSADVVYLDNAATSQKPECVIQAERDFYEKSNANPLRGLYALAEKATKEYEDARKTVADFIGAADSSEIIFTRNATEGLNLAAYCLSQIMLKEDDEIVVRNITAIFCHGSRPQEEQVRFLNLLNVQKTAL